jgi:hypothetical protein
VDILKGRLAYRLCQGILIAVWARVRVPDLSYEWRRSIADNWRRMLPHMRRGLARVQERLEAEKDPEVRIKLEEKIARRLDGFCKADAAIQAATVCTQTERHSSTNEASVAPRTSTEWVQAMMRDASAQERTITPTQSNSRDERMARSRWLILRSLAFLGHSNASIRRDI